MTETITRLSTTLTVAELGEAANIHARKTVFQREMEVKSKNTRIAYRTDIKTWCEFLTAVEHPADPVAWLEEDAQWADVTHGLIDAFVQWMKAEGFAIGTINRKLASVRKRARIAARAGYLNAVELALIRDIPAISHAAGIEIDRQRPVTRIKRPQAKKEASTRLLYEQTTQLMQQQPDTPQGRRDALIFHLLFRHGLRAGEIAALQVENFNLKTGYVTFYRDKVDKTQRHRVRKETMIALRSYLSAAGAPKNGSLILCSKKNGELSTQSMGEWGITMRSKELARRIGIEGFSAHDGRHYWATDAVINKTDPFALKNAGGWNSMATVSRYVDEAAVANDGVNLSDD